MAKKKKKIGSLKSKYAAAKGHGKNFLANAKSPAMQIGLATAGVVASQKFLNFKELMKDQYAKDPNAIFFKHEGLIKVGGAIVTIAMWKTMPEWAKWLVIGVGIQGGIVAIREYTKDGTTGNSFVSQIGETQFNDAISSLAAEIKSVAEQSRTSVGANELNRNSTTSVGNIGMEGMGMGEGEDY